MKNLTLTTADVEKFAATTRHTLALFVGQFALLRPQFPTITEAAVDSMIAAIRADPLGTPKRPDIDNAVYFAACYLMGARKLEAEVDALPSHPDTVAVLHSIFGLVPACANSMNALTLVSRGGLMPELHLQERAPVIVARRNANKGHETRRKAMDWVRDQWRDHSHEYPSKADFARIHVGLVANKFGVGVTDKTIRERWLP